jgi:hypothetical protein
MMRATLGCAPCILADEVGNGVDSERGRRKEAAIFISSPCLAGKEG